MAFCGFFLASKKSYESYYLQLEKNKYAVYLYVFVIYEDYLRKIFDLTLYDMMIFIRSFFI